MTDILDPRAITGQEAATKALKHYGRKGMKWGQRIFTTGSSSSGSSDSGSSKSGSSDSSSSGGSSNAVSEDFANAAAAKSKSPSQLSNQEMQALITRLNLEKQFKQVMAQPAPAKKTSRTRKAGKFASDLVLDIGRTEIRRVAKTSASMLVEQKLLGGPKPTGKQFAKDLGKRIAPKEKKPKGDKNNE